MVGDEQLLDVALAAARAPCPCRRRRAGRPGGRARGRPGRTASRGARRRRRPSSSAARRVSSPGSPGPAPTSATHGPWSRSTRYGVIGCGISSLIVGDGRDATFRARRDVHLIRLATGRSDEVNVRPRKPTASRRSVRSPHGLSAQHPRRQASRAPRRHRPPGDRGRRLADAGGALRA